MIHYLYNSYIKMRYHFSFCAGCLMMLSELLSHKIAMPDYRENIMRFSAHFSVAEHALLQEILQQFVFDPMQEQALVQAVMQQSRFDPNAGHLGNDDYDSDEDGVAVCAHCINPPAPPLRDYYMWRMQAKQPAL